MHSIVRATKELQVFRSLEGRKHLTKEEKIDFYRAHQGFKGEKHLSKLLQHLTSDHIALYGLLLNNHGTTFQIDCLLIFPNQTLMLEVKNHQGEFIFRDDQLYSITLDKYYANPLHQLKKSDINLREMISGALPENPLQSQIIFTHEDFTLYTEKNPSILLPSQKSSFISHLNHIPGKIQKPHKHVAKKLTSAHMEHSPHTKLPYYSYNNLRKGLLCRDCRSPMHVYQRKLHCQKCDYQESQESGVLRNTIEFHTLFPEKEIATSMIAEWCALDISERSIRRILQSFMRHVKKNKGAHFIFYDRQ